MSEPTFYANKTFKNTFLLDKYKWSNISIYTKGTIVNPLNLKFQ